MPRAFPALRAGLCAAAVLASLTACGSSPPPAVAPSTQAAPKFSKPPPELGDGLVCGAAADLVLNVKDGIDLARFTRGATKPQSPAIQQALSAFVSGDRATKQREAGLIVGQCAAYGFYIITYQECLKASKAPPAQAARDCVEQRTWTLYTQQ